MPLFYSVYKCCLNSPSPRPLRLSALRRCKGKLRHQIPNGIKLWGWIVWNSTEHYEECCNDTLNHFEQLEFFIPTCKCIGILKFCLRQCNTIILSHYLLKDTARHARLCLVRDWTNLQCASGEIVMPSNNGHHAPLPCNIDNVRKFK